MSPSSDIAATRKCLCLGWARGPKHARRRRCLPRAAAGYEACDPSVLVGRPATMAELVQQVLAFDRVKAVGLGHRRVRDAYKCKEQPSAVACDSLNREDLNSSMRWSQLEPGPVLRREHCTEHQHRDDRAAGHPRPVRRNPSHTSDTSQQDFGGNSVQVVFVHREQGMEDDLPLTCPCLLCSWRCSCRTPQAPPLLLSLRSHTTDRHTAQCRILDPSADEAADEAAPIVGFPVQLNTTSQSVNVAAGVPLRTLLDYLSNARCAPVLVAPDV
jgi:hypothetical protein